MKPTKEQILDFLRHSNYIENERTQHAIEGAVRAWRYAYKHRNKITLDYILMIHKLLLKNVRPDIAGRLRDCDVYIGGYCKQFVSQALLKDQIKDWINNLNNSAYYETDVEKTIKAKHVEFERIHPFEDGNGRVGRILYNIHRLNLGLKLHIIHEGDEQMQYYTWFKYAE